MDGIPALDLWDLVIETLHPSPKSEWARSDLSREECEKHFERQANQKRLTSEQSCLREIDYVAPNVKLSRHNASLYLLRQCGRDQDDH